MTLKIDSGFAVYDNQEEEQRREATPLPTVFWGSRNFMRGQSIFLHSWEHTCYKMSDVHVLQEEFMKGLIVPDVLCVQLCVQPLIMRLDHNLA